MPVQIDSMRFCREGGRLSGHVDPAELSRLREMGCRVHELDYTLVGAIDSRRRPKLALALDGSLEVVCQRCLDPIDWPYQMSVDLYVAPTVQSLELMQEDAILASAELNVVTLIEDEIILEMPMAPKHGTCGIQGGYIS